MQWGLEQDRKASPETRIQKMSSGFSNVPRYKTYTPRPDRLYWALPIRFRRVEHQLHGCVFGLEYGGYQ